MIAVIVTDDFTGNPDLRQRVTNLPNVKVIRNTEVLEISGSVAVTGIKLRDLKTGRQWELHVDGVFPASAPRSILSHSSARLTPINMVKLRWGCSVKHPPRVCGQSET